MVKALLTRVAFPDSVFFGILMFAPTAVLAQFSLAPVRLTDAINEGALAALVHNTHPSARAQNDRGIAPESLPMERMLLVLKRSPEQRKELDTLLRDLQDKSSAAYHHWLAPPEFGRRFGAADADIRTITAWLQSHGLRVNQVGSGRTVIDFSGTAGQVRRAFHTEIHKYSVKGEEHWANASDPRIPAALAPVVGGIATLHNFRARSFAIDATPMKTALMRGSGSERPLFDSPAPLFNSSGDTHLLVPGDLATIYNIAPIYSQGITGKGSSIAVMARSDYNHQDVLDFRRQLGLSDNPPQIIINGTSSSIFGSDAFESTLDVSWSGAVAPDATISFIVSADTYATDGIDLSEQYAVDNNIAGIITESYGVCEAFAGQSFVDHLDSVREQAAAQGITFVVSAGDSGPYGCDDFDVETSASYSPSVNVRAASPYVTAVGGTQFNDSGNYAAFWGAQNAAGTFASALSYIPEVPWNDTCGFDYCFSNIVAGSGGQSSIYLKPSWQAGVPGIQDDGTRDLPDVSLTASAVHDGYLLCYNGSCESQCEGIFCFHRVGGTSASAPAWAGIVALLDQKAGARQGAINAELYNLAASESFSACNGSVAAPLPASTCVFNDVTVGNNDVPGDPGYGTSSAIYQAGAGYDLATGLGSVNALNLANAFKPLGTIPTTTALTVSPATLAHGSAASVTILVAPQTGAGAPSGAVAIQAPGVALGRVGFQLSSSSVSTTTAELAGGTYTIAAVYGGDAAFAGSTSAPVSVTVAPEASHATVRAVNTCPDYGLCPFPGGPYGSAVYLSTIVGGLSGFGFPSGAYALVDNGAALSAASPLNSGGSAVTPAIATFAVGTHSITATYAGDQSFNASASAPVTFNIQPARTTSTLQIGAGCGLLSVGGNSLVATVNTHSLGVAPTGTFTFLAAGIPIGSPVPVAGSAVFPGGYVTATLGLTTLPAGQSDVVAVYSGDANYLASSTSSAVNRGGSTCVAAAVNGASASITLAPDSFVSLFGAGLAQATQSASSAPLPFTIAGTSVTFTDSTGATEPARMSFVSPTQINCLLPPGLAAGGGTAQITTPAGATQIPVRIDYVSPGLFSVAGPAGQSILSVPYAAAQIIRVKADGTQTTEPVVSIDGQGNVTPVPIAFNGDQLTLVLYGTGIDEYAFDPYAVVFFGSKSASPSYFGPQGSFEGLDQINIDLPPTLAGSGQVAIALGVAGVDSNAVSVVFQ